MTLNNRIKSLLGLAAEACGSLFVVLVVFLLFMGFLYFLFPSRTPLRELVRSREPGPPRTAGKVVVEATLTRLMHDVRFRRGNSIAWGGAREGMQLYSQDAVQTLDHSGAKISFGSNDRLELGSNSLVVVTRVNPDDDNGPKSYRVQVDGELRGSLAAGRKMRMEFAASGHVASIAPGEARFKFSRSGRNVTALAVYRGEAQVAGEGGVVRVPANFGVSLQSGMAVGSARPLPGPPVLVGERRQVYRYRQLPPRATFRWNGAAGQYHLQLSDDVRFRGTLIDEKVDGNQFVTGKLASGSYFWRVSRVDDGREGAFSQVAECRLEQVQTPPELTVDFPPDSPPPGDFTLAGRTEPGTKVFVDGVEVAEVAEGRFRHRLRLNPGVNLIRVEAQDATGNASYASRIVYARTQPDTPVTSQ